MKTDHADLLNALDSMASSPMYALRRGVLRQAELLIVQQEEQTKSQANRIRQLSEWCQDSMNKGEACAASWDGCYYDNVAGYTDIGADIRQQLQLEKPHD